MFPCTRSLVLLYAVGCPLLPCLHPASPPCQGLLPPQGAEPKQLPALDHGADGVTVTLHPLVTASSCLPLVWKPDWGITYPSPADLLQKEKENCFSLPNADAPQRHQCGADATCGTWKAGRGSVAGQSSVWCCIRKDFAFVPFSLDLW